jgi:hypothetical protein
VRSVQATVKEWSADGGSVLLDDGAVLLLAADVLAGSRFRSLRLGQRLQLTVDDGVVVAVDLP